MLINESTILSEIIKLSKLKQKKKEISEKSNQVNKRITQKQSEYKTFLSNRKEEKKYVTMIKKNTFENTNNDYLYKKIVTIHTFPISQGNKINYKVTNDRLNTISTNDDSVFKEKLKEKYLFNIDFERIRKEKHFSTCKSSSFYHSFLNKDNECFMRNNKERRHYKQECGSKRII